MGATATGKTAIACELVQRFPVEIISIDSAMIYREMDIGTAKPDVETLKKAPHHLIDIIDPTDHYSVANCLNDVRKLVIEINDRRKIPLLVGGTMMYFNAIQNGIAKLPEADPLIRHAILDEADKYGWPHMHQKLIKLDPVRAREINPNDKSRIQRALEVCELTNDAMSDLQKAASYSKLDLDFVNILLMPDDRSWLHARINQRFAEMLDLGLVAEVERLLAKWPLDKDMPAMRCVGYRQVLEYLQGDVDFNTMHAKGCAATRQLAKRQLTWLRKWPNAHEYVAEDVGNLSQIVDFVGLMVKREG